MRTRIVVWLTLVATHVGAGAIGWVGGSDRLAAVVAGTIYLPLWPLAKFGAPVVQRSGWMFPPPTALGWTAVVVVWLAVWWGVAAGIAWFLARRCRAN
ncbi:MAG: hypothetical protein ABI593_04370 [Betaproteobacteria bacterium]